MDDNKSAIKKLLLVDTKTVAASSPKEAKPQQEKKKKEPKISNTNCYIYKGNLKIRPEIMLTQIRFEVFKTLEEAKEVCEEIFEHYEIRNHKTNQTLLKK